MATVTVGKGNVTKGRQTRRRKDKQYTTYGWMMGLGMVGLLLLASILWWGFNTIKTSLVSKLVDWEPVKQGVVEDITPVDAVLVREERVVSTPQGGKVKPVIPEGERVRKGALVAYVTVDTIETGNGQKAIPLYAPATGIVCYHVDGLEGLVTPENLEKLGAAKIIAAATSAAGQDEKTAVQAQSGQDGKTVSQVQSGQPVFKIFNNLKPTYFLSDLSKAGIPAGFVAEDKIVYARLKSEDEPISFRIMPGAKGGNPQYLSMLTSSYRPEFVHSRAAKIDLISSSFQGYIIPKGALVNKDGQTGIYIVYKETASWEPVKVKGEVKDQAVVKPAKKPGLTRLIPNALVVTNPELVQEGQPVYVR